jgi:hypothetical protein
MAFLFLVKDYHYDYEYETISNFHIPHNVQADMYTNMYVNMRENMYMQNNKINMSWKENIYYIIGSICSLIGICYLLDKIYYHKQNLL